MVLLTRADGRRVFLLGVAGLLPAALVTLLLVHQPSIGGRRLYPMLRGPLSVVGLALALATIAAWATDTDRFSRRNLSGVAWAGLTATLCIGPFLESTPRARLYGLELATGEVVWARKRAVTDPDIVAGELVVTDVGSGDIIGLDPATGEERWRRETTGAETVASLREPAGAPEIVAGDIAGSGGGSPWTLSLPGETAIGVAASDGEGYAYVFTPGADGDDGAAIVSFDTDDGGFRWRRALPESVTVHDGFPAIGAGGGEVVVAGGERIAALAASDGRILWSQSVVSLGKSRGYALPGSFQEVIVTDSRVIVLATPQT